MSASLANAARRLAASAWHRRAGLPTTVDAERIAARLAVDDRARNDGASEQPASTEHRLTGTPREIVAYFGELHRDARQRAARLSDKLRTQFDRIDLPEAAARLRDIPSRCEEALHRLHVENQSRLIWLEERVLQQREHYLAFRSRNGLDRLAEYPTLRVLYWAAAPVLAAACVVVLRDPGALGIDADTAILSWPWTAVIAATVGLLPFVCGATLFRSVNHRSGSRQLAGWLGGGLALAIVAALALVVGYVSAVGGADSAADLRTMIDSMLANPAVLAASATASVTPAIVLLLGVLGFLVGYSSDDAYPGYGGVQRAYYRARGEHDTLVSRLRKRADAITDEADTEALALPRRLRAKIRRCARLVEASRRARANLRDYGVALQDACDVVLDRYRTANLGARTTAVPDHFADHVCFSPDDRTAASEPGDERVRLDELTRRIAELEREAGQIREQLRAMRRAALTGPELASAL